MIQLQIQPLQTILRFWIIMLFYLFSTYNPYNSTSNNLPSGFPCFNNDSEYYNADHMVLTRFGCYRIILVCFMCALGPFVFFNVQKTKYLQLFTTLTRWLGTYPFYTSYFLVLSRLSTYYTLLLKSWDPSWHQCYYQH